MSSQRPRTLIVDSTFAPDYVAVLMPAEEGGYVITACKPIVTTQGEDLRQAMDALQEAVDLYEEDEKEESSDQQTGRCGSRAPRLVPADEITRWGAFCALPAGHAGWHRGDDGCEWNILQEPEAT